MDRKSDRPKDLGVIDTTELEVKQSKGVVVFRRAIPGRGQLIHLAVETPAGYYGTAYGIEAARELARTILGEIAELEAAQGKARPPETSN